MSRFSDPGFDPPSRDDLAWEHLGDEYAQFLVEEEQRVADAARLRSLHSLRSLAHMHRDKQMRSQGDVWADDYTGPAA